jgi:mycofactocin system glycosyltransferase
MTSVFTCDTEWHRAKDGLGVLAGSPLSYFSVSAAGAQILDAIESSSALPINHASLTDRLLAAGAIHPVPSMPTDLREITVVIPAFVRDDAALESLTALVTDLHGLAVIVVDDCSPVTIQLAGATVIRHDINRGPGAARNTGLALITTPYVAFVDTDISVDSAKLSNLAAYLDDDRVAVVAPRVVTEVGSSFIAEYESMHSPLDLGSDPALVRPVSRVSYMPSAVLIARTSTLKSVNGFVSTMRVGEDVDLVWRLVEAGHWCRYVPAIQCVHAPRNSYAGLLRQRFDYGSSAAQLDSQHPFSASPFRAHVLFTIPAVALLMGYLYMALLAVLPAIAFVLYSLRRASIPMSAKFLIARRGLVSSTTLLTQSIARAWCPLFFLASFVSIRLGAMFTFSVLVPPVWAILRRKPRYTLRYLGTRILDNFSYGIGVWAGAIRIKKLRCILPVITVRRSASR